MANKRQLEWLKNGVKEWNAWRKEDGKGVDIDLRRADLRDLDLRGADLNLVNLADADLRRTNLEVADLTGANLNSANLSYADLEGTDLSGANLAGVSFYRSNLEATDLSVANLKGANLRVADVWNANLKYAILEGASFGFSSLGNLDLSGSLGLAEVDHHSPSTLGTDTLERTALGLKNAPPERRGEVETFLRGAGVPEVLMYGFQSMVESPIEFYSVFISYSHRDQPFALRLYEALQARGIRCWLDEHALLPGDDIADSIDHGIRIWDKVLLCCSEDSLRSYWVEAEVDKAVEKERQLRKDRGKKVHAIIPLDLDGYLQHWQDGRASMIRKRLAADFTGWDSDHSKFEVQLERVCEALKTARDPDPEPKL